MARRSVDVYAWMARLGVRERSELGFGFRCGGLFGAGFIGGAGRGRGWCSQTREEIDDVAGAEGRDGDASRALQR